MGRAVLDEHVGAREVGRVLVVSRTPALRLSLGLLFEAAGRPVELFGAASELPLEAPDAGCIVAETRSEPSPRIEVLGRAKARLPVIIVAEAADVSRGLRALTSGAFDLFEIPFSPSDLLQSVERAVAASSARENDGSEPIQVRLTLREHQVLHQLVAGRSAKAIGKLIGISPRTVETHRARIMRKLSARNLADAVRIALENGMVRAPPPVTRARAAPVRTGSGLPEWPSRPDFLERAGQGSGR